LHLADWSGGDASRGERERTCVDDTEEAWMFHIIPDDTGISAASVAKKVPDGEVSACCLASMGDRKKRNINNTTRLLWH